MTTTSARSVTMGLTREEDVELRRLVFMARFGGLEPQLVERIVELRRRDRRRRVREP